MTRLPGHSKNYNEERAAESKRLVEELADFTDEMNDWEKGFIYDLAERIDRFGEKTYVSDAQFDKLSEVYRRIIE